MDRTTWKGDVAVMAVNLHGEVGAASRNAGYQLEYVVWKERRSQLLSVPSLRAKSQHRRGSA